MKPKFLNFVLKRFRISQDRRRILANLYWAVLGKCVSVAGELLVGIFVARMLGPEKFGMMSYVIGFVTLFSVLSNFGLDGIEVRELSRPMTSKGKLLGTLFAIRCMFALLALLVIFLFMLYLEQDSGTFRLVMLYASSLLTTPLSVIRNYFTSIIKHEYVAKSEMSRTLLGAGVKAAVLLVHPSLTFLIAAFALDFFLLAFGYLVAYRLKAEACVGRWTIDLGLAKILLRASFPLFLSSAAIVFYQKINTIMIWKMLDDASVGYFSVAAKLTEFMLFVPLILSQSITPLLVSAHAQGSGFYKRKRREFMDCMVWIGIALSLFISLSAYPLVLFLYGNNFYPAVSVLRIMAWKILFASLFIATGQCIIIEGIQVYAVLRNVVGAVACYFLNLWLIPVYGIEGCAYGVVVTFVLSGFVSHGFIPKYRHLFMLEISSFVFGAKRLLLKVKNA